MLYQFRYPRTRPWNGYAKAVHKLLKAKDETLIIEFDACQEHRTKLVALLDDCAKDGRMAPKDLILILNEYIPCLDKFMASVTENGIKFDKKLEIVWTSVFSTFINSKSMSYSLNWEKIMILILLGICEYQRALELHRTNRVQAAEQAKELKEEKKADNDYESVYGDIKPIEDPEILDSKEMTKKISFHLKAASGVWGMIKDLYPGNIETAKKEYSMICETIPDITEVLSKMAKANVQEFFVQQGVQSKLSKSLVGKLAMGVASDLNDCSKKLQLGIPKNISVKQDFRYYLQDRSLLYKAIAHKYFGKYCKENDKFTDAAGHFRDGKLALGFGNPNKLIVALKQVQRDIKPDVYGLNCLIGIEHSIIKQIKDITALENEIKDDIFGYPIPKSEDMEAIEAKFPKGGSPTFESFDDYTEFVGKDS